MKESITLYHDEREDITRDVTARFEQDALIIDGYDIGKRVEEWWGESDYEYVMTIPIANLPPLYRLLNVENGDRMELCQTLAKRFHGYRCFSRFRDFLDQNGIDYNYFFWT